MMSTIYELIGRAVVRFAWARYRREITIAGAALGGAVVAGAYLLSRREPPEG
jgi:hypothetical protein